MAENFTFRSSRKGYDQDEVNMALDEAATKARQLENERTSAERALERLRRDVEEARAGDVGGSVGSRLTDVDDADVGVGQAGLQFLRGEQGRGGKGHGREGQAEGGDEAPRPLLCGSHVIVSML